MLEKELAQALKMAEQANRKVEQLQKKLLSETEKAYARVTTDLAEARKKHSSANARLKKARGALQGKPGTANQKRVEGLVGQVQELAESVGKIARAAYTSAERLVPIQADLALESRRAQAADRAASVVEKAAARRQQVQGKAGRKTAAKKKSAAGSRKAAAPRKKAVTGKAATAKKAAPKKKAAAPKKKAVAPKKKAMPKKKAAASRKATPKKKATSATSS
ncbi:hypothetical protein [Kineobactrum salinum]|uniref:Uncharacterized protein n=1 Tax=Kineobactrum salinum TaxID=2708301 RepID=A0A6C0U064_9GAMM|nr:hypothetical protein [Kineobactrum salinum]QIB65421.1 hypothetical protein G3T16_08415 [Kineobactrum salinum]